MKNLTVYVKGSTYKFPGIYENYLYKITSLGHLQVMERLTEEKVAIFKEWDYCLLEWEE